MVFLSRLCIFCFVFSLSNLFCDFEQKPILVVIPSYNNCEWYFKNLSSVFDQEYENYSIIYINDNSSDKTGDLVEAFVKERITDYQIVTFTAPREADIQSSTEEFIKLVNKKKCFFTLVNNKYRQYGSLGNIYRAVYSADDDTIILNLDGDDWLSRSDVFAELNETYSKKNVWLTHGRFIEYPHGASDWSLKIPDSVVKENAFRKFRMPSHLRTYYSWLFKKIRLEDLLYEGVFCPMTGDMALMFPMIEMAGERHAYIDKVNYVYNMASSINDNKVNAQLQRDIDAYIRALPPYPRLP